jgi:hypothetical protein
MVRHYGNIGEVKVIVEFAQVDTQAQSCSGVVTFVIPDHLIAKAGHCRFPLSFTYDRTKQLQLYLPDSWKDKPAMGSVAQTISEIIYQGMCSLGIRGSFVSVPS